MTRVYHGTDLAGAARLVRAGVRSGLYVTETRALAVRYAAAQATRTVDPDVTALPAGAVVLTIETREPVAWSRQDPQRAASLDLCETTIAAGRLVAAEAAVDPEQEARLEAGRCRYHETPQIGAHRMATTCLTCAYTIVRARVQETMMRPHRHDEHDAQHPPEFYVFACDECDRRAQDADVHRRAEGPGPWPGDQLTREWAYDPNERPQSI